MINNIRRKIITERGSTTSDIKNDKILLKKANRNTALAKLKYAKINDMVCTYYKIGTSY